METTLIFAGIPALVIVLIVGAVYTGGSRRSRRYRPGRPFEFTPVWFLSAPERHPDATARELTGVSRPALEAAHDAGEKANDEWPAEKSVHEHVTGGASDRW
jgi:hypothetical protein